MKHAILVLSILLAACESSSHGPVCVAEAQPVMHEFPNGQTLKSERQVCSNSCYRFVALNMSGTSALECSIVPAIK